MFDFTGLEALSYFMLPLNIVKMLEEIIVLTFEFIMLENLEREQDNIVLLHLKWPRLQENIECKVRDLI